MNKTSKDCLRKWFNVITFRVSPLEATTFVMLASVIYDLLSFALDSPVLKHGRVDLVLHIC